MQHERGRCPLFNWVALLAFVLFGDATAENMFPPWPSASPAPLNRVLNATTLGSGLGGLPAGFTGTNAQLGAGLQGIGDWDRDGVADFAATAPLQHKLHVFLMRPNGQVRQVVTVSPTSQGFPPASRPAPSVLGDFTGNAWWGHDIAFVGYRALENGTRGVRLLVGQLAPEAVTDVTVRMDSTFEPGTTMQYSRSTAGLEAIPSGEIRFGIGVGAADINGDGVVDLIVGADKVEGAPGTGTDTGAVFLITRNSSGSVTGLA